MRLVLDASVAVKWFVPEILSREARAILPRLQSGDLQLSAPESIVAEFGHALRKHAVAGRLEANQCQGFVRDFLGLSIERTAIAPLAEVAMGLATSHMATFYDALYLALAQREDLRVLTADERMVNAFGSLNRTLTLASLG